MGRVEDAKALQATDPAKAEAIYKQIVQDTPDQASDTKMKDYELAVMALGEIYRDKRFITPSLETVSGMLTSP